MRIRELIKKIASGEEFPEDLETYMQDYVPNVMLKSETLQIAYDIEDSEMAILYDEGCEDYEQDRFENAKQIFRILALLNPYVDKYWLALGASEQCLGLYEKALKSYAVAAVVESNDPTPHRRAAEIYCAMDKPNEANLATALAKKLEKRESHVSR